MKQILLLVVAIVTLASCSKDNDPPMPTLVNTIWNWSDNSTKNITIKFYDSSKGKIFSYGTSSFVAEANWSLNDKKIKVTFEDNGLKEWNGEYDGTNLYLDGNKYTKQ